MYALNQTNSLYFFPHTLSFAPPKAEMERDHWLLRNHGSAGWRWVHPISAHRLPARGNIRTEQAELDRHAKEFDRMDDDGAPPRSQQDEG